MANIDEIINFARTNNNQIGYYLLADLVKTTPNITIDLDEAISILADNGITIQPDIDEEYNADNEDPEKFIPSDVSISQRNTSISNIMDRLEYQEFNLKPAFQRKSGLWSEEQQSRLIESMMLMIPLPAFYFDATSEGNWTVIDGLQRLTAFQNYLVGEPQKNGSKLKHKFKGLQFLSDFNGKTFDELPRPYIRRIKETQIIAYNVEKGTPDEVVYNIFQRINTGGLHLEDQEIRNALYQGKGTEFLKKLSQKTEFLIATENKISPDRMLDQEYVLRFIAFTSLNYEKLYKGNIGNYLVKTLKTLNTMDSDELDEIEEHFARVMQACHDIMGKYAFRRYNLKTNNRGSLNKAVFELWSNMLYKLEYEELDKLRRNKDDVIKGFSKLLEDTDFSNNIKGGDAYSVRHRMEEGFDFIRRYI